MMAKAKKAAKKQITTAKERATLVKKVRAAAGPPSDKVDKRDRLRQVEAEYLEIERACRDKNLDAEYMIFPVRQVETTRSQDEFLRIVSGSHYALSGYTSFEDAREAAVELSKLGGIKKVVVLRRKSKVVANSTFDNGKQVSLISIQGLI